MLSLVANNKIVDMPTFADVANDEYTLLNQIVEGDSLAFEAFYKIYYPRLYRFILRITRQADYVEELIQETLMVVWEKPDNFNFDSKISTWIFGIAYNKSLKFLSKIGRYAGDVEVESLQDTLGDDTANQAQSLESRDWINTGLALLSPEQRAVVELTFYHDLSYQEIARIQNCPENTVKTRMFHARKKLHAFAANQEN